jgi:hypothetical protein
LGDQDGEASRVCSRRIAVEGVVEEVEELVHRVLGDRHVTSHGEIVHAPRRRVHAPHWRLFVRCVGIVEVEVWQLRDRSPPFEPGDAPDLEPFLKYLHGLLGEVLFDVMWAVHHVVEATSPRGVLGHVALALTHARAAAVDGPA